MRIQLSNDCTVVLLNILCASKHTTRQKSDGRKKKMIIVAMEKLASRLSMNRIFPIF